MKLNCLKYLGLLILMTGGCAYSQEDSILTSNYELIEQYLSESSNEGEDQNLYEILEELSSEPVDINSESPAELQRIPFIDLHTAELISGYMKKHGKFKSSKALYKIPGIDSNLVKIISPFLTFRSSRNNSLIPITHNKKIIGITLRSRISDDLGRADEYSNAGYSGSPYKIYNRADIKVSGKYELGFTTEKDPGEKSLNDLSSYRLVVKDIGPVEEFVLGDYIVKSGQGLALWGPYGFSKSANAVSGVKKNNLGIKPYRSTDENKFMRGAAASINFHQFSASLFYSANKFDAVIDSSSNSILSSPAAGYHRTATEIARRKNSEEKLFGAKFNYELSNARIGLLFYKSVFDKFYYEDIPNGGESKSFNFYSLDYSYGLGTINFFGETALSGITAATVNGLTAAPAKDIAFTILFRYYPWKYFNLHGLGFGEKNGTSDEIGFYTGIKLHTFAGIINFYYDVFKFPYAVFGVPAPSGGSEAAIYSTTKFPGKFEIRTKIKLENKDYASDNGTHKIISNKLTSDYRLEFIMKPGNNLKLKSRIEYKRLKDNSAAEESYMLFQEIRFSPLSPLTLTGRITLYRVPSFKTALYEYEYDLPGIFYNSILLGEGLRWYLLAGIRPFGKILVSVKYSASYVPDFKYEGFGGGRKDQNYDGKISVQTDFRF